MRAVWPDHRLALVAESRWQPCVAKTHNVLYTGFSVQGGASDTHYRTHATRRGLANDQATRNGLQPAEIVRQLVDERLPLANGRLQQSALKSDAGDTGNAATIALLDLWLREDFTDDPDELRKAEQELREFKRNMNAPRKGNGERLLFPEGKWDERLSASSGICRSALLPAQKGRRMLSR